MRDVELGEPQGPFTASHPVTQVAAWWYQRTARVPDVAKTKVKKKKKTKQEQCYYNIS